VDVEDVVRPMMDRTIEQTMQAALGYHQAGWLVEAEMLYRQVLAQVPDHVEALHLLGVLACQLGHAAAAIDLIGRAIAGAPEVAEYHSNLGEAYRKAGQGELALASLRRALELKPDLAPAYNSLGIVHKEQGRLDLAEDAYRRALELEPGYAEAATNLAGALLDQGRLAEALEALDQALVHRPDMVEAHYNRAAVLTAQGQLEEAAGAYRQTVALAPGMAAAHAGLAGVLKDLGRHAEAVAALDQAIALDPDRAELYNNRGIALRDQGKVLEALADYRRAIALGPTLPEAYNNLGNALCDQRELDQAIAGFDRAIALKPGYAEAHNNRGLALKESRDLDEALAAFDRALALEPGLAEAQSNRGSVLKDQGRLDEALTAFRAAAAARPDSPGTASNLLFMLHYHPDLDAQAIKAEHLRWAAHFATPLAAQFRPHPNDPDPNRKLRLGFVSPDFRGHPVGQSLVPLLTHLDRTRIEVVCFSDVRFADDVTRKLASLADRWHNTLGESDQELTERIRAAAIDILVDPTLHTAHGRLLVFARKPAPVQVTMLGPPATTGLATIDYRLTDRFLDPPGETDGDYTERSVRLPHCFWIYDRPEEAPEPGPLPAAERGLVTLGFLNQFAKIGPPVRQLWIRVLGALPGARLVLMADAGSHRGRLLEEFAAGGIAADRIEFVARAPRAEYFRRYQGLDLCLDPFPYNGHTSTLDALWMGVPVVTLSGRTAVGRGGASILANAGLTDLIARTPHEYVRIATALAENLDRLAALRAGLRPRIAASPLVDGTQYAGDVEAAFRRMWQTWCEAARP
jgi:predicted O-linked N-acetylglucosamine transferase (SPINDLY family)